MSFNTLSLCLPKKQNLKKCDSNIEIREQRPIVSLIFLYVGVALQILHIRQETRILYVTTITLLT